MADVLISIISSEVNEDHHFKFTNLPKIHQPAYLEH